MTQIAFENPWAWIIGLPLAAVVLLWFGWSHRRQGRSRQQVAALIGLRSGGLLILLLLASRPVLVDPETELPKRDQIILLVDRSESMSLENEKETRYRRAVGFARSELLPAFSAAGLRVEPLLFAEDAVTASGTQIANASPDGKQTNLAGAIVQTLVQTERPPLAVVALTDGATTEDTHNARAIANLVENHVPFIGVGFGDETGTRVLSLEHVTAPAVAPSSQEFHVSARLRATGREELPRFDLVLLRDGQFLKQKTITVGSGARMWQESFPVTESEEGVHSYTIRLLPPSDRSVKCPNTEASAAVRIREEKELRVLFVQGGLTWDYKFIRLALQADPTIRVTGLSRTASESTFFQNVEDAADLVGGFPSTIERLAPFRVVVLSNLRVNDLTSIQQDLIARFCRDLGGGVLMIGGAGTFDASWQRSRLEQLLPVRFAPPARGPWRGQPFRLRITEDALAHPVFQISDAGDNRAAWARLPKFSHFAAVDSVKPGAQIWAVHPASGSATTGPVLMASQRYGAGLSAVICMQNFWRWRLAKETQTQHFDRFWQQLFRYLGEGSRDAVIVRLPDQQLQPGANVRLVLQRRPNPRRVGTAREDYRVRVTDGNNESVSDQTIELESGQSAEVTFDVEESGLFTVSVLDEKGIVAATRSLQIKAVDKEFNYTARNMETLRQWATVSHGIAIRCEDCDDVGRLVDQIKTAAEPARRKTAVRRPAGINGWMLAALLGCLCAEWSLRKRWRLT